MNFVSHGIIRIQTESRRIRKSKWILSVWQNHLIISTTISFSVFLPPCRLGKFFQKFSIFKNCDLEKIFNFRKWVILKIENNIKWRQDQRKFRSENSWNIMRMLKLQLVFSFEVFEIAATPFHYSKNKNSARHECCSFYYSLGVRDDRRPVGKKVFSKTTARK